MKNKELQSRRNGKIRKLAPENYLIVCEGKETEPNYIKGIKRLIEEKYKDKLDVLIPNIEIKGEGKNTISLVEYTRKYINQSNKIYGKVWVFFDKDEYSNEQFNKAITMCNKNGYSVGWSNPCIEIFLLSHFKKEERNLSSEEVEKELNKEFERNKLGKYSKNDSNIFTKLTSVNNIDTIIENCRYMEELNEDAQPAERNPMTKAYMLLIDLKDYL